MDCIYSLRYRNIELETELRLVKEQLAQAQSSTQYLVQCLSSHSTQDQTARLERTEARLHRAQAENHHLRDRLALAQDVGGQMTTRPGLRITPLEKLGHFRDHDLELRTRPHRLEVAHDGDDDLLTFADDEISPFASSIFSPADSIQTSGVGESSLIDDSPLIPLMPITPYQYKQNVFNCSATADSAGLGVYNLHPSKQSTVLSDCSDLLSRDSMHDFVSGVTAIPNSRSTAEPGLEHTFESETEVIGEWRAIQPQPSSEPELVFGKPFMDSEHNRLLGAALFVQDIPEDEYDAHWEEVSKQLGRHSASEWKLYYEEVVRPIYLAKLREKEDDAMVGEDDAVVGEDDSVVGEEDAVVGAEDDRPNEDGDQAQDFKGALETGKGFEHEDLHNADASESVELTCETSHYQVSSLNRCEEALDVERSRERINRSTDDTPNLLESENQVNAVRDAVTAGKNLNVSRDMVERAVGSVRLPNNEMNGFHEIAEFHNLSANGDTPFCNSQNGIPSAVLDATTMISTLPIHRTSSNSTSHKSRHSDRPGRNGHSSTRSTDIADFLCNIKSDDESRFHTVVISGIPTNISFAETIEKVCGGKIVSATFVETAEMKTDPPLGGNSVMVVFLDASSAKKYVDFCQKHGLFFNVADDKLVAKAEVQLVRTPTRRPPGLLLSNMRERGMTRVLFIIDEERKWTPKDVIDKFVQHNEEIKRTHKSAGDEFVRHHWEIKRPLVADRDGDGVLFFEFANARDAGEAWEVVHGADWFFAGASKGFLHDPCDRPLGTLLQSDSGVTEKKSDEGSMAVPAPRSIGLQASKWAIREGTVEGAASGQWYERGRCGGGY